MECESLKKATLTGQITEQTTGMITPDQLEPGDKLPNERDLAESFGITRSRMQEALRALSLVGTLTVKSGDDSFVSEKGTKVPGETVMWIYYQEMNKHDKIYAARNLTEAGVYLTCYGNRTPKALEKLNGFRDRLLDVETEEITTGTFCQLLTDIDTYVGDVYGSGIYVGLMRIMVLVRKESAMRILSLASSKESATLYRCGILNSFYQDDRNKVKKCLNDSFKYSVREISI